MYVSSSQMWDPLACLWSGNDRRFHVAWTDQLYGADMENKHFPLEMPDLHMLHRLSLQKQYAQFLQQTPGNPGLTWEGVQHVHRKSNVFHKH